MQFTTVFIAAIAATMAAASPIAQPEAAVAAKAKSQTVIDLWDNKKFLGLKFTGDAAPGDCKNLPKDFNNIITSGKSRAGFRCTVWVDHDCNGTGFSFNANPGVEALPDWINNKVSSWKCVNA